MGNFVPQFPAVHPHPTIVESEDFRDIVKYWVGAGFIANV